VLGRVPTAALPTLHHFQAQGTASTCLPLCIVLYFYEYSKVPQGIAEEIQSSKEILKVLKEIQREHLEFLNFQEETSF